MEKERIYLIGYMGAGKTTIGKHLAHRMDWSFIDLDKMIEEKYKLSIECLFQRFGEDLFRQLETEVLKETGNCHKTIIATGGGTPCYNGNIDWMNANGLTIFIKVSPESAAHRVLHSKKHRPLLEQKSEGELLDFIKEHYSSRFPYYDQANLTIKGENCNAEMLLNIIENE